MNGRIFVLYTKIKAKAAVEVETSIVLEKRTIAGKRKFHCAKLFTRKLYGIGQKVAQCLLYTLHLIRFRERSMRRATKTKYK